MRKSCENGTIFAKTKYPLNLTVILHAWYIFCLNIKKTYENSVAIRAEIFAKIRKFS
jgi:hypothetical protein